MSLKDKSTLGNGLSHGTKVLLDLRGKMLRRTDGKQKQRGLTPMK